MGNDDIISELTNPTWDQIIRDSLNWLYHECLSREMIRCMFFCDKYNIIFFGGISLIVPLLLILTYIVIVTLQTQKIFEGLIIIIILPLLMVLIYIKIKKSGLTESIRFAENNVNSQITGPHHGIIFMRYQDKKKQDFTVDCIKLLGEGLQQNGERFKIYECSEPNDFIQRYIDPNVTHLWIIGHGRKNRLNFDNHKKIFYTDLPKVDPKEFVAQLHCGNGEGDPLPIVNKAKAQFYSKYYRLSHQNRCYILNKMKDYSISKRW